MKKTPTPEPTSTMPSIGEILKKYFKANKTSQAALARVLQKDDRNIWRYKNEPSLQTSILWELSLALKHNFFAEIAAQLPDHFPPENPLLQAKEQEIAALKLEIANLQREKELLKELVKR